MSNDEKTKDQWLQALYTNDTIKIPHGKFKQKLRDGDVTVKEFSQYERVFKEKQTRLKSIDLQFSPLKIGLYNFF